MALYLISYDIVEDDAWEYDKLWAKLREIKAVKVLYSEWIVIREVISSGHASAIYYEIAPFVQKKDRLLVQEVTKDAKWDKLLISDEDFQRYLAYARA